MIKRATFVADEHIGETIRKVRQAKGLSIREAAVLSGFSPAAISRWENGERIPSVTKYDKIMTALGAELLVMESK